MPHNSVIEISRAEVFPPALAKLTRFDDCRQNLGTASKAANDMSVARKTNWFPGDGSQYVNSDFQELQVHMQSCTVQRSPLGTILEYVRRSFEFTKTRLVTSVCVLTATGLTATALLKI